MAGIESEITITGTKLVLESKTENTKVYIVQESTLTKPNPTPNIIQCREIVN